ncbi:MAG: amino acid--[acyl-carrier-protein] ligase [Geminicoccaceae bacterium]|nr:amino acid--[acyl-carrier-protein] ligase [Geminicoccaceae bacterium]
MLEDLLARLEALVDRFAAEDAAERPRFPPACARADVERSGYLEGLPHLLGTVHAFEGDEREHRALLAESRDGRDWTRSQRSTAIVLAPAACYPVYPPIAARGPLSSRGVLVAVASWCFRHEPSGEPTRLQFFRMREQVCFGISEQDFRARWMERAQALVRALEMPRRLAVANDPFFGRAGRVLEESQRAQSLKFELSIPVHDPERPTACFSFNYHRDHFARSFGIRNAEGTFAHTACTGFGLERLAFALMRHHGLDPGAWPRTVRAVPWSRRCAP